MSIQTKNKNYQANEDISKFKLLSAYGGAGSIIHTQYGSIIISCIEEWGFLKKINELHKEAVDLDKDIIDYVIEQASLPRNGSIQISNDFRFLEKFKERKGLKNLQYFVLIPDIEIRESSNTIKDFKELSIPSTFMPKIFHSRNNRYREYKEWYQLWSEDEKTNFFPPKYRWGEESYKVTELTQDNIVLICDSGHISSFPWSRFLKYKNEKFISSKEIDLFEISPCCSKSDIYITASTSNASGFEGKYLRCKHCNSLTSLQGLFNIKIKCPGHKPWIVTTGEAKSYYGNENSRNNEPPKDPCTRIMKVALTTGNNLYYSRLMSSIYLPQELFKSENKLNKEKLNKEMIKYRNLINEEKDDTLIKIYSNKINDIRKKVKEISTEKDENSLDDDKTEVKYRHQEFFAFLNKKIEELNIDSEHLKVSDSTDSLKYNSKIQSLFQRVLCIDNMKITSAQLDFSRVHPFDGDQGDDGVKPQNIFRGFPDGIISYPVIESYGEGIFFAFSEDAILQFSKENEKIIQQWKKRFTMELVDEFEKSALKKADEDNWQLYLIHTFSHLIMRELEFRCGYPTSSLQERIYVSNDERFKMYGCLIFTAEGSEGSMGGLIAQTKNKNLVDLIESAMIRATVCHSDPLCWESTGQGLFNLNFAGCFSCALVSETSCEHRNIYLDRGLLVDEETGFFREVIK